MGTKATDNHGYPAMIRTDPSEADVSGEKSMPEIDHDLMCMSCGYNLRGLSPDGRCPECGSLIVATINGGRPPLPLYYRLARLAIVTLCIGSGCLVAASAAFRVQHPRSLWYFWGDVGGVGILVGLVVLAASFAFLLFFRSARRDILVWACLPISLCLVWWGMGIVSRARE
jgi:hypothetical protein